MQTCTRTESPATSSRPSHGEPPQWSRSTASQTRRRSAARQRRRPSGPAQRLLQIDDCVSPVHAVDRSQRPDDHFARGERRDQTDADLPVEAERLDHRLDCAADRARRSCSRWEAVCRSASADWPAPTGPSLTARITVPARRQEDLRAIEQTQRKRRARRPAVRRHFQHKRVRLALQNRRLQHPRGEERGKKAEHI